MIRILSTFVHIGAPALLISEILLVTGSFVLACTFFLQVDVTVYLLYEDGLIRIILVVISILLGLYIQGLYSYPHVKASFMLISQLLLAVGIAFLTQGLISYLFSSFRMPGRIMVVGSLLAILLSFVLRMVFSKYALSLFTDEQILFVGASSILMDISAYIQQHPGTGLSIAGYVGDLDNLRGVVPESKLFGALSALQEAVRATSPRRIVIGVFERRNQVPVMELLKLRLSGYIIEEATTVYERVCGRISIKELRPSQLIYSGEMGPRRETLRFQSVFNAVIAALVVTAMFPVILIVAFVVLISYRGLIQRELRVGQYGRTFTFYRFRTVCGGGDASAAPGWPAKEDQRLTPVGRFLHKLRLDELPQFVNVLRGEMSIVGPRPERPEFVRVLSDKIPYYRHRHSVRPGITGWAQVHSSGLDAFEDTITALEYDLYYVKNMSVSLDIYIIFRTFKRMLSTIGQYQS